MTPIPYYPMIKFYGLRLEPEYQVNWNSLNRWHYRAKRECL